jgi:hypothetical protein
MSESQGIIRRNIALLDATSLVKTVDNINAMFLTGQIIAPEEGLEAARWIATRQGEKGAYRTMFTPTQSDFEQGIHVFTGEKLVYASARHIMGEEAARVVWLLGRQDPGVRVAYDRATGWMHADKGFQQTGTFCCGRCTLAFWRHFWVGNFTNKEESLLKGLQALEAARQGNGKWRRYPFFYAVYTLLDINLEPAYGELKYARLAMEQSLKRARSEVYSQRRRIILEKALEKAN